MLTKGMIMNQSEKLKYYTLNILCLLMLTCPLLPWMSYGVGSKTGLDVGGNSVLLILLLSLVMLILSFILARTEKAKKFFLYFLLLLSLSVTFIYYYQLARIAYQTTIAKTLPVEMFGVVALATNQIKIGYGLWVGSSAALVATIFNYLSIRMLNK